MFFKPLLASLILLIGTASAVWTSLYSENDRVLELVDANITASIYNADKLWVVEFYAHWCGHCQRFAPTWIKVAENFKSWDDHVMVGAVNCAEQDCGAFNIKGTPTLRVFYQGTPPGTMGVDINIHDNNDATFITGVTMEHLAQAQKAGLDTAVQAEGANLLYYEPDSYLQIFSDIADARPKTSVFLIEGNDNNPLGLKVLHALGQRQPEEMKVRRVSFNSASVMREYFTDVERLPAVVYARDEETAGKVGTTFYPNHFDHQSRSMTQQIMEFLDNLDQAEDFITTTTRPISSSTNSPVQIPSQPDLVYEADLENAIEYSVVQEIGAQPVLNTAMLSTLYLYLDVITSFLPLRVELKDFLVSLKEWPVQRQLSSVTGKDYQEKVAELTRLYKPFEGTPKDWKACQGSNPKYRGYPCSLWSLFHTLTVNAAIKGDPSMQYGSPSSVAKAMVGYIQHFFSCRHCAHNFAEKVKKLGFLPATPQDSILWLWQIHNLANKNLKGDLTEDPEHPKIIWPSPANCPSCRAGPTSLRGKLPVAIDGQDWNLDQTVSYLIRIYRKESIVPNSWGRQSQARRRGNVRRPAGQLRKQLPQTRREQLSEGRRQQPQQQLSMRRRFWEQQ